MLSAVAACQRREDVLQVADGHGGYGGLTGTITGDSRTRVRASIRAWARSLRRCCARSAAHPVSLIPS